VGRPPAWNPISTLDQTSWMEAVDIATEDRINLPIEIRRRLGWLDTKHVIHLLAVLGDQGQIELLLWEPHGRKILERVGLALTALPDAERQDVLIAAMDRYSRAALARDGRLILPNAAAIHLQAGGSQFAQFVSCNGRVWLWPAAAWQARRQGRFEQLEAALSETVVVPQPAVRLASFQATRRRRLAQASA
jgi:hypothetical protein